MFIVEIELEEFVLKIGKFDICIEDQMVFIEVLKLVIIENKNIWSIEIVLDQVFGLNILDGELQICGGSGFMFGVGFKVVVIVDDMLMFFGDVGCLEWGFIFVENIVQVEIIKGVVFVFFGSLVFLGFIYICIVYLIDKLFIKVYVYFGMYFKLNVFGVVWYNDFFLIFGVNFLYLCKIKNWDFVVGGNFNYDYGYIGLL